MKRILRGWIKDFEVIKGNEVYPDDKLKCFNDKISAVSFLSDFMQDPFNLGIMRNVVLENSFCDISRLTDHDIVEQLAWLLYSGRIKITESHQYNPLSFQSKNGKDANRAEKGANEQAAYSESASKKEYKYEVEPAILEPAKEEHEIEFVIESETTGHILPFHDFKLFDENDKLIAAAQSDENGEVRIGVPKGNYYVVIDREETFSVQGTALMRDAITPLSDIVIDAKPWLKESFSFRTGKSGELELTDIPMGELILNCQGSTFSVWVDKDMDNISIIFPYVDIEQKQTEHDYGPEPDDSIEIDLIEINPDEY